MTTTVVANLDAMFDRKAYEAFHPPITRVVSHLFKLLLGCSHTK